MQLLEDVRDECGKYGKVEGIAVPRPPPTVGPSEPSRVYIKFGTPDEAGKVKDAFNGRQFDGNNITAAFASEDDFNQAAAGQWTGAAPQAPALGGFMASPTGEEQVCPDEKVCPDKTRHAVEGAAKEAPWHVLHPGYRMAALSL